jgi:uncharacterized protein (DUF736 family)
MQIGHFEKSSEGYHGLLRALGIDEPISIVPAAPSDAENAPDWRVHLGTTDSGPEIGAGWDRSGDKAGRYISMLIDSPVLTQPIRARLFRSERHEGRHDLVWTRPQTPTEKDD